MSITDKEKQGRRQENGNHANTSIKNFSGMHDRVLLGKDSELAMIDEMSFNLGLSMGLGIAAILIIIFIIKDYFSD